MPNAEIPLIEIDALFGPATARRDEVDARILAAASHAGFMTIAGFPDAIPLGADMRAEMLRVFTLDEAAKRRLWRRKFAPDHANVYRGWFPLQDGAMTYKEGIDLGPDLAHPRRVRDPHDPLTEATPLPRPHELPRWRDCVATYYRGMETLGRTLMHAVARGLGLPERFFEPFFAEGISTLRLIRYPVRPPESFAGADPAHVFVEHAGRRRHTIGGAHVDSGFVTLLAQDGVEGLQARARDGGWIDVPPREGTICVNFGGLLERWTGGRIRATEHRVLGPERERCSIPFFYEPAVDARIEPLPLPDAPRFAPFLYGDHLWAAMLRFVEFRGLEDARKPRMPSTA
jgi:isopenicillin N synthase-like dioxygenase